MKTTSSIQSSASIPQSEAILGAIKAGFFEVYFDKNRLTNILSKSSCKAIRLKLESLRNGEGTFVAEAISNGGKRKAIAVAKAAISHHFQNSSFYAFLKKCQVEFSRQDMVNLLTARRCVGLRFMPCKITRHRSIIAVGVQAGGFDIADGAGYICGK